MVMKLNITLKVAKGVDNESATFSEASLGRSVWEWKPEEDASSVEFGSSTDHDTSSSNESSATSEDGNSSSSSSSSSSSTSSSSVEVVPQKKAVPRKGTKRPVTTTKQSAKKCCTDPHQGGRSRRGYMHTNITNGNFPRSVHALALPLLPL